MARKVFKGKIKMLVFLLWGVKLKTFLFFQLFFLISKVSIGIMYITFVME